MPNTQTLLSTRALALNGVFPWANILGPNLKKLSCCQCYGFQRVDVQQRTNLFEPGAESTVIKRVKERNNLKRLEEKAFLCKI